MDVDWTRLGWTRSVLDQRPKRGLNGRMIGEKKEEEGRRMAGILQFNSFKSRSTLKRERERIVEPLINDSMYVRPFRPSGQNRPFEM